MMLWPTMAVVGFVVLAGLVIALGRESTARYEYERNSVERLRLQQPAMAAAVATPAAGGSAGTAGVPALPLVQRQALSMAAHPAGSRTTDRAPAPSAESSWWLVDGAGIEPGIAQVVAGPFADRMDAEWATVAQGLAASARPVYGVPRADGTVLRRQSPQDRAWLAELGAHLARLPEEWDGLLSDTDPLTTLVVEVAAALVEAGLPLHDCAEPHPVGGSSAGGVCLTPDPGSAGILVSWQQHDRMSVQQVRGAGAVAGVHETMTMAVAQVLAQLGFDVETVPASGCFRVTSGTADFR